MDELKKVFKLFTKENVSLVLLLIYSVSFFNYYLYYKSFNVSISNYLTITDLVYFTVEYVFQIILIIVVYEICFFIVFTFFWTIYERIVLIMRKRLLFYLRLTKAQKAKITDLFEKPFHKGLGNFKLLVAFIGILFIGMLPNKLLFIPAYFVYMIYLIEMIVTEKETLNFSIPMVTVIIILCLLFSTLYNSYTKRFEKDEFSISFYENNEFVTTEKCQSTLNYLGETTTNIFLYDIDSKVSRIYSKSKITNLEIQNTSNLDTYIIMFRDSYLVKSFREMLNE